MEHMDIFDLDFCQDTVQVVEGGWSAPRVYTATAAAAEASVKVGYTITNGPNGYVVGASTAHAVAAGAAAAISFNKPAIATVTVGTGTRV